MSLKRRDFLKIAGGLSLGAPLYNCSLKRISDSAAKSRWLSPLERWIPTVCQGCPGGCGILARVIDDRVVKVEGNPLHPLNRGKVCPKGQAGLQALYHPDRIKSPLKKTGNRNSGRWEAVSWEEALDDVASRLKELRGSGKSHTVVFLGQNFQKATEDLVIRFLQAYGTPNYIKFDDWLTIKKAHLATQGIFDLLAVDLERTKLVLSFGADFLTNWPVSIENQRIYGEKRSNRDITIFHVEPRFSLCASRADRWIPINPGTEALFALGVASVIVKEKLYDEAYIRRFTLHFEEFEEILLKSIRLDRVSDLTGVPLRVLIEIAKEFSTQKPAVAVADHNLSYSSKGYFSALAIHHLNALVGSIDVPGGLLRQRKAPLKKISPPALDEVARKGLSQPRIDGSTEDKFSPVQDKTKTFCENVIKKNPYGIHCLFLLNQNPLLSRPLSETVKEALQRMPFIVSFSSFMNESAQMADLILPDTTYFEKWQENQAPSLFRVPVVGLGQPVIKPLYQSRPFEDVILALARRMDPSLSRSFPWRDFRELLFYRLEGLFEAKKGCVFTSPYEEAQLRLLEERGWWVPQHDSKNAFLKDLLEKGGWQDPSYHFNERSYIYQTPKQRFEFSPSFPDEEILPEFTGNALNYPFHLYLYELPFTSTEEGVSLPWHQETMGFRFKSRWRLWVEINPETAAKVGIRDKDLVWVESPYGKVQATAKIFPGIMPHVVSLPIGKKEGISGPVQRKDDPFLLVGGAYSEHRGRYWKHSVRVKIYKQRG